MLGHKISLLYLECRVTHGEAKTVKDIFPPLVYSQYTYTSQRIIQISTVDGRSQVIEPSSSVVPEPHSEEAEWECVVECRP